MLLFNWIGYRLFASYVENKFNLQLEAQIDDNKFDETQLVSIKVPVSHLAYYNVSRTFERIDGQIEIKGISYKYVKRRLYNDSLEVICIPNKAATQLNTATNEFFKSVNDLQSNPQSKKTGSHKDLSKTLSTDNYTLNDFFAVNDMNALLSKELSRYSENLISTYSVTDEQPPDILS
jgi:hypothetical protein